MAKGKAHPYYGGSYAERGATRKQLHILLEETHRKKLISLSKKMKLSASDVVRTLIAEA